MTERNLFGTRTTGLLAGVVFVLLTSGTLFAGETLTLQNGSTTVTGTIGPGPVFQDSYDGVVGHWDLTSASGLSFISGSTETLDLTVQAMATLNNPGNLIVTYTETGLTGPPPLNPVTISIGGTNSGTTTTYVTKVNSDTIDSQSFVTNGGFSGGTTTSVPVVSPVPYSLTVVETITGNKTGGSLTSGNYQLDVTTTPEPGFYGLAGLGLAGLWIVITRRKNKSAAAEVQ